MKIDPKKADDSLHWDFLEEMLFGYHFPRRMVKWIMVCVRTVAYLLAFNWENHGTFHKASGARQGDPMSPHLVCAYYGVLFEDY